MNDEHDDLMHLNDLNELSLRAGIAHAEEQEPNGLEYERWGVCTPDLIARAQAYAVETLQEASAAGGNVIAAMTLQFLAGFDIGYQARLEIESRTQAKADIFDREDTT